MPLEINEIDISMRVRDADLEPDEQQPAILPGDWRDISREDLADDCVRRVLQILKSMGGR